MKEEKQLYKISLLEKVKIAEDHGINWRDAMEMSWNEIERKIEEKATKKKRKQGKVIKNMWRGYYNR